MLLHKGMEWRMRNQLMDYQVPCHKLWPFWVRLDITTQGDK
jgi:hypothetical protein